MLVTRKLPRRSMSLLDRMNKSDIEDKSLSNDETPLPTCPRQPPDGVETPSDVVEKIPEPPARLPPRLPSGWAPRPRLSYTSRTQDPRSEASVKDKIAMFSNDHSVSTDRLEKCGTLPTRNQTSTKKNTPSYMGSYTDVSSLDRRLTKSQDNLDELPRSYKRQSERPEVLGATESVPCPTLAPMKSSRAIISESKPLFYGSTNTLPLKDITFHQMPPIVSHTRSVSDDNGNKNYKSNLEYLIEQRKKSMSKLRGLVIPETRAPVVDLPEIKVQDSLSKSFQMPIFNKTSSNRKEEKTNSTKPIILNDSKWKTNLLSNNIPKYSPAFKRKSLQVYSISCLSKESTPERKFNEKLDILAKTHTLGDYKVSRNGLDSKMLSGNKYTSTLPTKFSSTNRYLCKDFKHILNDDVKVCTITDVVDSDNDSAMSSTQSSYRSSASSPMHTVDTLESDSSRLSPRISHYTTYSLVKTEIPTKSSILEKNCEEYTKRSVCRSVSSDTNVSLSSSAGSAATSGSQASCSSLESSINDSEKRKVIKTYNIDTINRRNILASAKCRSGRDAKLKSPVVETKFSHESQDEPSSPPPKASDRLSTLTSSVSAMSNKGESRRRNKVIADTDSDSDSEINVRQRKPEFKNTRLKRSLSNKNKQSDTVDSPKIDDPPKIAPEKSLKDNKKIVSNTTGTKASLLDKIQIETKKTENILKRKEEVVPKQASYTQKKDLILNHEKTVPSVKPNANVLKTIPNGKTNGNHVDDNKVTTQTIRLRRGVASGVGLILAGGADCEAKDVTVHRVLADSIAAKAGLKRGVKVRSINGRAMKGLTHAQSVSILKEQRTEVVIEVENETHKIANGPHYGSENAESVARNGTKKTSAAEPVVTVLVEKAGGGAGLGFGLDGGKDSPSGDRPLTIKKLFAGGAAAQSGRVLVGATLLSAGGTSMEGFTRTQAWAALKALPAGPVSLVLRNPKTN